jgi:hypothetical protein
VSRSERPSTRNGGEEQLTAVRSTARSHPPSAWTAATTRRPDYASRGRAGAYRPRKAPNVHSLVLVQLTNRSRRGCDPPAAHLRLPVLRQYFGETRRLFAAADRHFDGETKLSHSTFLWVRKVEPSRIRPSNSSRYCPRMTLSLVRQLFLLLVSLSFPYSQSNEHSRLLISVPSSLISYPYTIKP